MPKKTSQSLVDQFAELVASGQSVAAAARTVGIAARTARTLVTKPEFKQAVALLRQDLMMQVAGSMGEVVTLAVTGLVELLKDKSLDPELRFKVCRGAFADWIALAGQVDLAQRMAEAEKKLEQALGLSGSAAED